MATKRKKSEQRAVAVNRKARHNYFIEEVFEAGLVLTGPEVKSLRAGHASINEAFAADKDGEFFLMNSHISPYAATQHFGQDPHRPRKLLLHKRDQLKILLFPPKKLQRVRLVTLQLLVVLLMLVLY